MTGIGKKLKASDGLGELIEGSLRSFITRKPEPGIKAYGKYSQGIQNQTNERILDYINENNLPLTTHRIGSTYSYMGNVVNI